MSINSKKMANLQMLLWAIYLILFPFQLFPPGSLQIADLLMLIGISSVFLNKWTIDNYVKNLSYFVFYSILIGIFYTLFYYDFEFIKQPLNYVYCLSSLVFISQIVKHPKFISSTIFAIFFSLVVQLYVFKIIGINVEEARVILFFNNPNQLGLWALSLLVFIILLIVNNSMRLNNKLIIYTSLILCYFFIFLSISQAAIISSGIILIILFGFFLRTKWVYLTLSILIIISLLFASKFNLENIIFLNNVQNRIENETKDDLGDNGLEGRNYTRLLNNTKYLIFGAGEGKVERFNDNKLEIHSTFANILFSYGIVGLIIFMMPFLNFINRKSIILILLLGSYFIFTLVHNTIRWPIFWIIPYLLYTLHLQNNKKFSNLNIVN